jgi:hypothetical protein
MILDNNLSFEGPACAALTTPRASTNVLDFGVARDLGIGNDLNLAIVSNQLFAGGTNVTISLQGSPDNSTYTVYAQSPAITLAQFNSVGLFFPIDIPRRPYPTLALPRYFKLTYTVSGTFTAGAVQAYLLLNRDDVVYYSSNYNNAYT